MDNKTLVYHKQTTRQDFKGKAYKMEQTKKITGG